MTDAKLRLFAAVSVPHPVLEALEASVEALQQSLPAARWTPLDNQHVTLKFLGWTPAEGLGDVEAACDAIAAATRPFSVSVTRLGAFPSATRARVLWAGIDDPYSELASIASALDKSLEPLGFEPEKREFTAHLTLARFKTPARLGSSIDRVVERTEPFEVGSFELHRSHLSPAGARYEVLRSFVLRGEG